MKMLGLIADRLVVARLWQLGFRVDVRHFDEVQVEDLQDRALLVVSMIADRTAIDYSGWWAMTR